MSVVRNVALFALVLAGCESKKPEGLPPAKDWQAPTEAPAGGMDQSAPRGAGDPHAGVPGAPPLGGGGDPHAGVEGAPPLGGSGGGGGGGGGVDVTQMGLPSPDRSRPIDPNKYLEGTVTVGAANAAKIPAGAVIFLSIKTPDAEGNPVGMPLATDKLVAGGTWPIPFRIDEAKAMVDGTKFAGDVVIVAWYDQDQEPMRKQPGDVLGQVRATIPAKNLVISLDKVLE